MVSFLPPHSNYSFADASPRPGGAPLPLDLAQQQQQHASNFHSTAYLSVSRPVNQRAYTDAPALYDTDIPTYDTMVDVRNGGVARATRGNAQRKDEQQTQQQHQRQHRMAKHASMHRSISAPSYGKGNGNASDSNSKDTDDIYRLLVHAAADDEAVTVQDNDMASTYRFPDPNVPSQRNDARREFANQPSFRYISHADGDRDQVEDVKPGNGQASNETIVRVHIISDRFSACVPCRMRKIRCMPSDQMPAPLSGVCGTCIKRKKCCFWPEANPPSKGRTASKTVMPSLERAIAMDNDSGVESADEGGMSRKRDAMCGMQDGADKSLRSSKTARLSDQDASGELDPDYLAPELEPKGQENLAALMMRAPLESSSFRTMSQPMAYYPYAGHHPYNATTAELQMVTPGTGYMSTTTAATGPAWHTLNGWPPLHGVTTDYSMEKRPTPSEIHSVGRNVSLPSGNSTAVKGDESESIPNGTMTTFTTAIGSAAPSQLSSVTPPSSSGSPVDCEPSKFGSYFYTDQPQQPQQQHQHHQHNFASAYTPSQHSVSSLSSPSSSQDCHGSCAGSAYSHGFPSQDSQLSVYEHLQQDSSATAASLYATPAAMEKLATATANTEGNRAISPPIRTGTPSVVGGGNGVDWPSSDFIPFTAA